jgi:hypothetical protein
MPFQSEECSTSSAARKLYLTLLENDCHPPFGGEAKFLAKKTASRWAHRLEMLWRKSDSPTQQPGGSNSYYLRAGKVCHPPFGGGSKKNRGGALLAAIEMPFRKSD